MISSTAYQTAYQMAIRQLSQADLDEVIFNSSAHLKDGLIYLDFLGNTYQIEQSGKRITMVEDATREVNIAEKIIMLHYLVTADGTPLTREEIAFKDIPGAGFYYPTYKKRTMDYLVSVFKNDLTKFLKTSEALGGRVMETEEDKVKVKFLVLPNVPITLIYWRGETGELFPSLQILYDANVTHYLPLEDIVILPELLVHKLVNL